jgi:hypothetical protein
LSVELGSDGLGEFSSEDHDFESVEVGEVLSELLLFNHLSLSAFGEEFGGLVEFGLESFDVRVLGESLQGVLGWLDSLDGDNLSLY